MKKILLILAALVSVSAFASQPLRRYVTRTTDDGRSVTVTRYGNDQFSWWEDDEGTRYSFDASQKRLQRITMPPQEERTRPNRAMNASTEDGIGAYGKSGMGVVKSIGAPVIPVIMMAFDDLDFLPANDKTKIDRFLNEEGYNDEQFAVGSVADYFRHCSYGAFTPRFDIVAKVTLPNGYKYYGAKSGSASDARRAEAVREAVRLAEEQGVDFSKYSSNGRSPLISILHAGPGEQEDFGDDFEDFLWAHFSATIISAKTTTFDSYLLTNESMRDFDKEGNVTSEYMTGIGTFCHEMGHALGLPDMYDVNGGTNGAGHTPGYWDVMDYQFMYNGFRPMEYSGYERAMMGWLEVEDLTMDQNENAYEVKPLATNRGDGNKLYRIVNPTNPKEYVLLENRQKSTFFASSLLGTGLLAWHINYESSRWASNTVNTSANEQRVHVIPADGNWQANQDINKRDADNKCYTFTGDVFPGYASVTTLDSLLDSHLTTWFNTAVRDIAQDAAGNVTFNFGSISTDISDNLMPPSLNANPYDLQGRRTNGTLGKGVYIINDKKIIIK